MLRAKEFDFSKITSEQEDKIRELSLRTGLTFQEAAKQLFSGQKSLVKY